MLLANKPFSFKVIIGEGHISQKYTRGECKIRYSIAEQDNMGREEVSETEKIHSMSGDVNFDYEKLHTVENPSKNFFFHLLSSKVIFLLISAKIGVAC